MLKKKNTIKKTNSKISKPITTKSGEVKITDNLINKVFPIIIERFAKTLKSLQAGESLRFGRLGSFKKTLRQVRSPENGKLYKGYQYSFKAFSLVKK
ncbi:MAG: hypothetical protein GBAus27B_000279 [Mycoplasmataceae bacterium]|nr:MAG: hypothetical protein GBAus27B_000279 [Mycoplasmataceae bacterium]